MDRISIEIARAVSAARGLQVEHKDKDLMSDTGGKTKGRDREPFQKPPREDVKNRYRTKDTPSKEREKDIQKDPDRKPDLDIRVSKITSNVVANMRTFTRARTVLARYPETFLIAVRMG
jgi:hypothetical protein